MQTLLISNRSPGAHGLIDFGKENLDADGLAGLQFTGGNGAKATFAEIDRAARNSFGHAGFQDDNIDGSRDVVTRQHASSNSRARAPSLCSGRHHWLIRPAENRDTFPLASGWRQDEVVCERS